GSKTITATIDGQPLASVAPTVTVTAVNANLAAKYRTLGRAAVQLGPSLTGDLATLYGGGVYQQFQNGALFYSPATSAPVIDNVPASAYFAAANQKDAGGNVIQKLLGLPTSDDKSTSLAGMNVVSFQGGKIFESATSGAYLLYGAIASEYAITANQKDTFGH